MIFLVPDFIILGQVIIFSKNNSHFMQLNLLVIFFNVNYIADYIARFQLLLTLFYKINIHNTTHEMQNMYQVLFYY